MKQAIIYLIKFYQLFSRSVLRHNALPLIFYSSCRYSPSCSDYAIESITKHGPWKGSLRSLYRVLRCNPFMPINQ